MSKISLIVLSAGNSSRFNQHTKKQWLRIDETPLWLFVTKKLSHAYKFDKIIVTSHPDELSYMQSFDASFEYICGADTRQGSLNNALKNISSPYVMVTDVARSCVPLDIIYTLIEHKEHAECIVPSISVSDTVVYHNQTINREDVKLIQTPQLSHTKVLQKALSTQTTFTDESSAIKDIGGSVYFIQGDEASRKLTHHSDLAHLSCLTKPSKKVFCGSGFDTHCFEANKSMILGGVNIDVDYGLKAHSDGDVAIHSLIDALLGACGAGDIGEFFPDTNMQYKNADSKILLSQIVQFIQDVGYEINNVDITIIAQQPKLTHYKTPMRFKLAEILNISANCVNIKATTAEKMGFIGRKEGIAVLSNATLQFYDWSTQ